MSEEIKERVIKGKDKELSPADLKKKSLETALAKIEKAYVAASSMGAQPYDILPQYTTLWVQAIVYFLLATYTYARMLRREPSH